MTNRILDKVPLPASYPRKSDIIARHGASFYYSRNDPTAGDIIGVPVSNGKFVSWYQWDEHKHGYVLRGTSSPDSVPQAQLWTQTRKRPSLAVIGSAHIWRV